ncbi:MAG: hypothetical protein FWD15_03095 [Alphaproteobacteria bacterium]|nr:hypothetical protein [Alphaproteobacteria bacterium]
MKKKNVLLDFIVAAILVAGIWYAHVKSKQAAIFEHNYHRMVYIMEVEVPPIHHEVCWRDMSRHVQGGILSPEAASDWYNRCRAKRRDEFVVEAATHLLELKRMNARAR